MMKNLILILPVACLVVSCSSLKPAAHKAQPAAQQGGGNASSGHSVEFINSISIKPGGPQDASGSGISPVPSSGTASSAGDAAAIESLPALQFKFAILENASVEELNNAKLLSFMDYWYGTPYHYGGTTRDGIDCSAFAFLLMSSVYGISALPRTSKEQYDAVPHVRREDLQEGDLVFFHTLGKRRAVTHVGIYLRNNKFIHASVSGVMISDMSDGYYDKRFIGAGRPAPVQNAGQPAMAEKAGS